MDQIYGDYYQREIHGDYQLGEFLGKGQYGNVYDCGHVKEPSLNGKLCIKILNKNKGKQGQNIQKLIDREVDLMKKTKNIKNENLVQIYDFIDTNQEFALVMEKCGGGDLENYLTKCKQLPFQVAHNFIGQLINGYFDLYQLNIIHHDLKPANILLSSDCKTIKITDFWMGRVLEDLKKQQKLTSVGIPAYSSPQIYFRQDYSAKCDIYSLGALFYQILFNQMICGPISSHDLLRQFIYTMESKPFKVPNKPEIPQYMKTMIEQMLAYREEDRLDFPQLYTSYGKYFDIPLKIFEIINTNQTQFSQNYHSSCLIYQGQQQIQTQQNNINLEFKVQTAQFQNRFQNSKQQGDQTIQYQNQTPPWVENIQKLIEYLMGCAEFISIAAAQIKQHSHLTGMDPNTLFYLLASMYGFIYSATLNVYGLKNNQPQLISKSIALALGSDDTEKLKFLSSDKFEQSYTISQWLQKFSSQSYNDFYFYVQISSSYDFYNVDTLKQLLLNSNSIDFEIFLQWSNYLFKTFAKKSFQFQQQYSIHLDYLRFIYLFFYSSQLNDFCPLGNFKNFTKEILFAYQIYTSVQLQQKLMVLMI